MDTRNIDWPDGWVVHCPDNWPFVRIWGKNDITYNPRDPECPDPVFYNDAKNGPVVFRSRAMAEQHAKKIAQGFPKWKRAAEVVHTKDVMNLLSSYQTAPRCAEIEFKDLPEETQHRIIDACISEFTAGYFLVKKVADTGRGVHQLQEEHFYFNVLKYGIGLPKSLDPELPPLDLSRWTVVKGPAS